MAVYAAWMTLLACGYFLLPGSRAVCWGLLVLSGVLAIVAGVIINRPAAPAAWLLLAAANLSFAIGQTSFLVIIGIRHESLPFPSPVDAFYLSTYPIYAAGLLIFIRRRGTGHDRRSLLDALTVTVSLALLSWMYLILPYVHNSALSWQQKAVSIAYPIGDVLVLAMLARLLLPGTWRTRSLQLLTLGTLGLLASDVSFGLLQLYGSFHVGTATDLGWIVFYAAWGAAALHPSMTRLTEPITASQPPSSRFRLVLIMLAALVAPVVLFVESFDATVIDAGVIAVCSAAAVSPGAVTPRGCRVRAAPGARPGAGPAAGGGRAGRGRDRGAGVRRDPVRGRPAARRPPAARPRSWPCGTKAASAWSVRPPGCRPSPRTCPPSWPRTGRLCSPGMPPACWPARTPATVAASCSARWP